MRPRLFELLMCGGKQKRAETNRGRRRSLTSAKGGAVISHLFEKSCFAAKFILKSCQKPWKFILKSHWSCHAAKEIEDGRNVKSGVVLSNSGTVRAKGAIRYLPVYSVMFL